MKLASPIAALMLVLSLGLLLHAAPVSAGRASTGGAGRGAAAAGRGASMGTGGTGSGPVTGGGHARIDPSRRRHWAGAVTHPARQDCTDQPQSLFKALRVDRCPLRPLRVAHR